MSKTENEKTKGMKTFDFKIKGLPVKTSGYDGCLVVDKSTKVNGGSQNNTKSEVQKTIDHLKNDPKGRVFIVLLDGNFWEDFRNENRGKYNNVIILNSDELVRWMNNMI
jgi:hypothetical protein